MIGYEIILTKLSIFICQNTDGPLRIVPIKMFQKAECILKRLSNLQK